MNTKIAKSTFSGLAAAGLLLAGTTSVNAFDWVNITQNGNPDISSQIQMTVSQQAGGEVDFSFRNSGSVNSVITTVYFNYGSLFSGHLSQDGFSKSVRWLLPTTFEPPEIHLQCLRPDSQYRTQPRLKPRSCRPSKLQKGQCTSRSCCDHRATHQPQKSECFHTRPVPAGHMCQKLWLPIPPADQY